MKREINMAKRRATNCEQSRVANTKEEKKLNVLSILVMAIIIMSTMIFFTTDFYVRSDTQAELNKAKGYNEVAEQPYLVADDKVIIENENNELTIEHLDKNSDKIIISGTDLNDITNSETIYLYQDDVIHYYELLGGKSDVKGSSEDKMIVVKENGRATLYKYGHQKELGKLSLIQKFIYTKSKDDIYDTE